MSAASVYFATTDFANGANQVRKKPRLFPGAAAFAVQSWGSIRTVR